MNRASRRWHIFPTDGELVDAVVAEILAHAAAAIEVRGRFVIVLAGGTTPRAVYQRLRTVDLDWSSWQVLFGDERCRPVGDGDRNDTLADAAWLSKVAIPATQVCRIPAQLGPVAGSEAYGNAIADVGEFDLTLLGLGEDGHTASLFPGQRHGLVPDAPDVVPVHHAPKPPPERISLSAPRLSRSRSVLFLTSGAGKRAALRWLAADADIPAAAIRPPGGVDVFADQAAAADLPACKLTPTPQRISPA